MLKPIVIKTLFLSLFASSIVAAQTYEVDDSYTPSSRFERYKKQDETLIKPDLVFKQGQAIRFEQTYATIGKRELHADLFMPHGRNLRQAIILVHGGGWRSGNKSHFYPLANLLAQKGYLVVLPEYRLSTEALYPAGLTDLNRVITWLRAQASELDFNPANIAIGGGSSGGHMAALIGNTVNQDWFHPPNSEAETNIQANTHVNAVIDLDGVLDFTHPLAIASENKRKEKSAAGLWFGGAMEDTLNKWQQASTALHIHANSPPMLVISSGQMRFTAGKDKTFAKLTQFDIAHQYYQYNGIIHTFWLFEPYLSETAVRIHQFFKENVLTGDAHDYQPKP
ncbi:alpha/beta hydrolase [Alteromonas sp. a30]|uniref:alpha/beta hydrolase n=1 Tax=Alteromonas sp. a30 TaxID=2730917 RepID=UPI00227DDE07|nr:alpha/beta hydrolase [Alteromonas sp. a30]MCY7297190.1 alpha/beta hydrolase [Alteromonas sp. a30]